MNLFSPRDAAEVLNCEGEPCLNKTPELNLGSKDALIITDIQKDFLRGGALHVPDGDQIILVLNDYAKLFKAANATVIASRDWHPQKHMSFREQGGPWPPHCVQETEGASFSPDLKLPEGTTIISKATNPAKEAYSVFDDTGLEEQLKAAGVSRVFIGGLATDYCIVNSVLDATSMGFDVVVLSDAVRGIDVNPGDVNRAFETMRRNGAVLLTLTAFPEPEPLSGAVNPVDVDADKPLTAHYIKKKARMRPRGSYKQVRRERG